MKTTFTIIQLLFCPLLLLSQSYNMTNGSISTCSGTFYDSGGSGNYSNSENFSFTICPDTPGQYIMLTFTHFNTESGYDFLSIYHNDVTSGSYTSYSGSSNIGVIRSETPSGCISLKFISDGSTNQGGWSANISCTSTLYTPPAGSICNTANAFCTENGTYNFPNSTSGVVPTGPDYGCLSSQPFPIWYYMRISQAGNLALFLQQNSLANNTGTGYDIDFAMWGPFSSLSNGCTQILNDNLHPIQCSFSSSATENIGIGLQGGYNDGRSTPPSALEGEFYILLLTNYRELPGFITFSQTSGTGQADCSIVPLSVRLESFNVYYEKGANHIDWKTIHEHDVAYYKIEKSEDGFMWYKFQDIDLIPESTESEKSYSIKDFNYKNVWNYYRLIEIRTDGSQETIVEKTIDNRIENKEVFKIINVMGQEVQRSSPGLKIIVFTDGTSIKII